MTDSLRTQIDSILEKCRDLLELSNKATPGPWWTKDIPSGLHVVSPEKGICTTLSIDKERNTSFISVSRTLTPQLAAAMVEAIEGHLQALEGIELVLHKFERAGGIWEVASKGVQLGAHSWASNVENGLNNAKSASESALERIASTFAQPSGGQQDDPGRERLKA